jgi:FtsZ-binding cell division protein ZapB
MIREANQINLGFPELSVLSKVHRNAEEWVDRASVALRSKISLDELESLVETGEKLPLGLTGTLEKLSSRYKQACEWIAKLRVEIPCPLESLNASGSNLDIDHRAEWLLKMLESIKDDDETFNVIIDLSAQGSRLPTEIDIVQLLQTAIDSRNWSLKAKKWVPNSGDQFKRGKIDDLRDHLESAETIIKMAEMLTDGKIDWCLDFEKDVSNIVEKADEWYEKVSFPILKILSN